MDCAETWPILPTARTCWEATWSRGTCSYPLSRVPSEATWGLHWGTTHKLNCNGSYRSPVYEPMTWVDYPCYSFLSSGGPSTRPSLHSWDIPHFAAARVNTPTVPAWSCPPGSCVQIHSSPEFRVIGVQARTTASHGQSCSSAYW